MERLYEGLFLLDANEAGKSWSDVASYIDHLFAKNQARLEYSERWSDKKLAYPVRGVTKGTYYLTYFRAPTARVNALRRDAEISERILRLLITQEEWTEEEMHKRREAARSRSEQTPEPEPLRLGDGEPEGGMEPRGPSGTVADEWQEEESSSHSEGAGEADE